MAFPLISVMIPAYNCEKYIKQAIDSILLQNYSPLEIIVVDDGSTDNTRNIVNDYDPAIVKYFYQKNYGEPYARNSCLKRARGDFFAWLDSDDYWLPGKLVAQLDYLNGNPKCDLVFTKVESFFDKKELELTMDNDMCDIISFSEKKIYFSTMLVRRETFFKVGYLDESLKYSDLEWLHKAYFSCAINLSNCIDRIFVKRRIHNGCISYLTRDTMEISKIVKKNFSHIRQAIKKQIEDR